MSLESFFQTHPFGPFPRALEWIYLNRTGGTLLDLNSELTYPSTTSGTVVRIVALDTGTVEIWQLQAGTHIDDPPNGWVRPLDYGLSINEKVWKRLLCFGSGGGGGATIPPTTNVLEGDGLGNAADTGIDRTLLVLKNPAFPTPLNSADIVALLQAYGLCA